jgi:hypothetical protein
MKPDPDQGGLETYLNNIKNTGNIHRGTDFGETFTEVRTSDGIESVIKIVEILMKKNQTQLG